MKFPSVRVKLPVTIAPRFSVTPAGPVLLMVRLLKVGVTEPFKVWSTRPLKFTDPVEAIESTSVLGPPAGINDIEVEAARIE